MIQLDFKDKKAIYEQIYDKIRQLILIEAIDYKLPSIRNLANDLGVNPNTVQKVYTMLEKDGYIYAVTGKGIFINNDFDKHLDKINDVQKKVDELITTAKLYEFSLEDIIEILTKKFK